MSKKGPGKPGPPDPRGFAASSLLGKPDLNEAFAALAFHKQKDASPTGLQRLGNGLGEICSVLDTALTETLDDVSRLQPLVKRRAAFFHFGDNHPAHIFVKAKFSRKLGIEVVHGKTELFKAFGVALAFFANDPDELVVVSHNWDELRRTMWDYVGIVRTDKRLQRARRRVRLLTQEVSEYYSNYRISKDLIELRNLIVVADLIIQSAIQRRESRGLHYSLDYPEIHQEANDTILVPPNYG